MQNDSLYMHLFLAFAHMPLAGWRFSVNHTLDGTTKRP
jgi:hypothetical protein